ncbi:DUF7558 family protein [Halococcoides cellulosivorans]|uniref:DUF7558 family protein n=1 Tax=Halococcoides cellulosivorans TaxID=1679096 RepID=UPI001F35BDD0|nr:hypothetical protein [Halococcoides cellulosivorans]
MQQTLVGCAFCDAPPGTETGVAHTWRQDERVSHPICVDCAIQTRSDPDECNLYACDGCGLVVDALAALTRFRVEVGHLDGPLRDSEVTGISHFQLFSSFDFSSSLSERRMRPRFEQK